MDTIYHRVAGLDLHEKTILANVRCINDKGDLDQETRSFATMTKDLLELAGGHDDPPRLADLARGRMRRKREALQASLEGGFREHHRFMLRQLLAHLNHLDQQLAEFNARIEAAMAPFVDEALAEKLDAIPGVNHTTIENVIVEIGTDMNRFPTADHPASWAGVCPGNDESAGKRNRTKTTKGNRWLRRALSEAGWAASHARQSYFSAQYHRLAGQRGKKQALIAVSHALLTGIYAILKHRTDYQDLGADYFMQLNPERLKRCFVKRLQQLGYEVSAVRSPAA